MSISLRTLKTCSDCVEMGMTTLVPYMRVLKFLVTDNYTDITLVCKSCGRTDRFNSEDIGYDGCSEGWTHTHGNYEKQIKYARKERRANASVV